MEMWETLSRLNAGDMQSRLASLEKMIAQESVKPVQRPEYANNHIHTTYSFSPYSPAAAVYFARAAGLQTSGIMDHDSVAGAEEFYRAGEIAGVATTCGIECRVSFDGTPLAGRLINNPDQPGVGYMSLHGIPQRHRAALQDAFAPLRAKRNVRNRAMTAKMNALTAPMGIMTDFDKDILPLSQYVSGGSVTERHILFALAGEIIAAAGTGSITTLLEQGLGIKLGDKQKTLLGGPDSPHLRYDLLGILKAELVSSIFIPATDECMHITDLKKLSLRVETPLFYPYLGDVGVSVTGDKKAAKYEDSYLDLLFETILSLGVDGVTYMPSRNTPEQLAHLQSKIRDARLQEISGEDINTPRQSFICPQLAQPQFKHLVAATWALIKREREA
jgi:hypothetical protein